MTAPFLLPDAALLAACRVESFRSHGPGGQHANRTDSAVRLTHLASGTVVQCQDHRQRGRNQDDALRRLRLRLACTLRDQGRQEWLAPWLRGGRFLLGPAAEAFPAVVAVALDALARQAGNLAAAAAELGCSASQLAKLLYADKEVRAAADALRAAHGLGHIHD